MSEMKETEAKRPIMPDAGADNRPLVELTHVEKHYDITVNTGDFIVTITAAKVKKEGVKTLKQRMFVL